ncbi:TLC ATP/ADP transporter, partial [Helicosporidium sp. ATCC 50920]
MAASASGAKAAARALSATDDAQRPIQDGHRPRPSNPAPFSAHRSHSPAQALRPPRASSSSVGASLRRRASHLRSVWPLFFPMACLFFLLSFVNTIVDGLKDSLVVTATGGGPHVLPFVTVYGVLPSSFLFLLAYSWASSRLSRARMFELVVSLFAAVFVVFGLAYPHHELLHLDNLAVFLSSLLPVGAAGLVGMLRNWTFSLFFCVSELWGDVCLSLLFWGLANEITALKDAALLYPLLGVGANLAQATAGR